MASSYTGICVYRDSSGQVTDVQVRDTGGNELPLPLATYISRGVNPPYQTLRECGDVLGSSEPPNPE
jgi:hypothetical protein